MSPSRSGACHPSPTQPLVVAADVHAAVRLQRIREEPVRREQVVIARTDAVARREEQACRVGERIAEPAVHDSRLCRPGAIERQRLADADRALPAPRPSAPRSRWRAGPAARRRRAAACRCTTRDGVVDERREPERKKRDGPVETPPAVSRAAPPVLDARVEIDHHADRSSAGTPMRRPRDREREQADRAEVQDRRGAEQAVARRPEDVEGVRICPSDLRPDRETRDQRSVHRLPRQHLRQEPDRGAPEKGRAAGEGLSRSFARSPDRAALISAPSASSPGSSANSRFCQRIERHEARRANRAAPTARSERLSRVAAHSHAKPATAAIDGACVMLGSFTRYHAMNDPLTVRNTAAPATALGEEHQRQPIHEPATEQTVEESGDADRLAVRERGAVRRDVEPSRAATATRRRGRRRRRATTRSRARSSTPIPRGRCESAGTGTVLSPSPSSR